MANLENDIREILRKCPNVVMEADQLRMLIAGNTQRIIDEYNDEDKKFGSLINEQIEEVPIDAPQLGINLLMVDSTPDKREEEDLGDTQGEPDPSDEPAPTPNEIPQNVVHPDDQPHPDN